MPEDTGTEAVTLSDGNGKALRETARTITILAPSLGNRSRNDGQNV